MSELKSYWTFYTDWLNDKLPLYYSYLNEGATWDEIAELKAHFPFELPSEMVELYRLNNGDTSQEQDLPTGTFMQFEFLSIPRLLHEYDQYKEIVQEHPGLLHADFDISYPEGTIKRTEFDPGWIPLFSDGSGNYIGVDMSPDSKGTTGQVINFGRDENLKFRIAKNLTDFFAFIKQKIESGQCEDSIVEEDDGGLSYGISPESQLLDDLKQIIVEGKK